MSWIRRTWTAEAAEEWTREDALAIVLSVLSYMLMIVGSALSFLAVTAGYVILALGLAAAAAMYWVIDPKLRAISAEYETQQKAHLERLEKITRWEKSE